MVNYVALLGWGPRDGVEVRPLEEIVEMFRLEDVSPSPAFFDIKKLQAFNAEKIRALPTESSRHEPGRSSRAATPPSEALRPSHRSCRSGCDC